MTQRDKNGDTASERVAKKFLSGELYGKKDANTTMEVANGGRLYMLFYGTRIARAVSGAVHILSGFEHSGTKTTKERQHALVVEAQRQGMVVTYD